MDTIQPAVLACVDGSNSSSSVCDYASWIAAETGAPLHLLHTIAHQSVPVVTDLSGSIGLGAQDELLEELTQLEQQRSKLLLKKGKLILEAAFERIKRAGVDNVTSGQRHGTLQENLVDMEEATRVLVIGLRGESSGENERGIGSKVESILRSLHRPMLIVNQAFVLPETILLAYDGSDAARKALNMVAHSPLFNKISCHVVFEGNESDASSHLSDAEAVLSGQVASVTTHHVEGDLAELLCNLQVKFDIDLTVMGAFSHGKLRDIIWGSLTSRVLKNTAKPLLLLR